MIEPYVRRGGFRKPQLGAGAARIAFGVGRLKLFLHWVTNGGEGRAKRWALMPLIGFNHRG